MVCSKKMQIASAAIALIGFIFLLVAICTNYWITSGVASNSGLWRTCSMGNCENLKIGSSRKYENYEMVRGFGVLAVCVCFLGIVLSLLNCVIRRVKIGPSVLATLYLMAAFFGLTSVALFTSIVNTKNSDTNRAWGYSFILGWFAFPLTLFPGVVMTYVELKMTN
ncbi:epithelial membrane protein 2 [Ciona intestinalis]